MKKLFRIISYYLGKKDFIYNDKVSKDMIPGDKLPDILMDRDVAIYNCGFDVERQLFLVIARPMKSIDDKLI